MSEKTISEDTRKKLLMFQRNEVTEHRIYMNLARAEKDPENRKVLEKIAGEEKKHAEILAKYTGASPKPMAFRVFWYTSIARILGLTFGVKLMERGEEAAESAYDEIAHEVPEAKQISEEEDAHEHALLDMLNEERLEYMGSIVLGLNDALVELTGALAGLTFALQNTRLTAAAGLITGIAASMSMAASEYLSTTAEAADGAEKGTAIKSAVYTGIAYIFTVIALILPYLLIANGIVALAVTLSIAVAIIFLFNYYLSVAKDLNFSRRFWEMALLSLGVAAISFGVGFVVRQVFGIEV
jgi:VIT1/CCC1 family predicted Fe2+/Mn2+ transporter